MRYSTVFSVVLAAATAAPALALPVGLWSRAAEDETLYERGLEDSLWARDVMPRGPPRPLPPTPKPAPRPLPPTPKPKPRPLPKPPKRRSTWSDSELEERDFDEESLFERSFDDEDVFWVRDVMPRGPPRPLPPTPKPAPRPLPPTPKPKPRPLPKPPRRRSLSEEEELLAREFEEELFARAMEIDELD
ncbi:uncharacterized protein B0H18DRAFT_1213783 [Fomitopsis serialis]|uniref:uncharacterized protein n=1 Tax=Fomitopsis serialis TaxID=139415 RepID=UPI002008B6F9|nr:uncharacterized protein B0H18DRAFT_1213783 [Neoantrodia serialis]KAH9919525.1 hypothetical protein B0H18DRAFT_1213783 [Neoantrodia serialis]